MIEVSRKAKQSWCIQSVGLGATFADHFACFSIVIRNKSLGEELLTKLVFKSLLFFFFFFFVGTESLNIIGFTNSKSLLSSK